MRLKIAEMTYPYTFVALNSLFNDSLDMRQEIWISTKISEFLVAIINEVLVPEFKSSRHSFKSRRCILEVSKPVG